MVKLVSKSLVIITQILDLGNNCPVNETVLTAVNPQAEIDSKMSKQTKRTEFVEK
ncbi:MAG: hypothetical protein ACI4TF_04600 [Oliverpabstia sp.]